MAAVGERLRSKDTRRIPESSVVDPLGWTALTERIITTSRILSQCQRTLGAWTRHLQFKLIASCDRTWKFSSLGFTRPIHGSTTWRTTFFLGLRTDQWILIGSVSTMLLVLLLGRFSLPSSRIWLFRHLITLATISSLNMARIISSGS